MRTPPRSRTPTVRLRRPRALSVTQRRHSVPRQGARPLFCGVKVALASPSMLELGASGRRGSNPRVPVTLSAAYKTEGIRPSWPPRSRTELYRLIRAAPTTGWAVAIERKMRVSSPTAARTATGVQSPLPRRRRTFHARRARRRPHRLNAHPLSKRRPPPGGFSPGSTLPPDANRREMAEGRRLERMAHARLAGPAARLVHPPRASDRTHGPRIRSTTGSRPVRSP